MKLQSGFSLIELMIAISLGILLCLGIFNVFTTLENLHQRQIALSTVQENMRFITEFLRQKIHKAGDWSCLSQSSAPRSIVIRRFNADQAQRKLSLTIKEGSDLLLLHECVRFHDHEKYLPLEFFIADTFRKNLDKKEIYALFFKIAHHPREELISNMTRLHIQLYHVPHSKKNIRAVKVYYLLTSENNILKNPQTYWFYDKEITSSNKKFYQPGILYVARRNTLT